MGREYVQKAAPTFVDNLFVNPLAGWKKPGNYRNDGIVAAYRALIGHYLPQTLRGAAVLRMSMRYADPRKAVHHTIVKRNYGCTPFTVGRDHTEAANFYRLNS